MSKKYTADIRLEITVEFEDNGTDDLRDQAIDAARSYDISYCDTDVTIIGEVKEIKK